MSRNIMQTMLIRMSCAKALVPMIAVLVCMCILTIPNSASGQSGYGPWSISFHGGIAIPTGSLADTFDYSYNLLFDLDYHFSPRLALVGFAGYNKFKSAVAGIENTHWINTSLNLRYIWPFQLAPGPTFSFYIQAGPGIYIPKDGDVQFGFNGGVGFNYSFNPPLFLEIGTDYHYLFDADMRFIHAHTGLFLRF